MVKPEVIRRRLQKLDEYIDILMSIRKEPKEKFIESPVIHGAAERYLHMAVETINDIGNHMIADDSLGSVNQYRDIPLTLFNAKRISEQQKDLWVMMIGFRNTLVHDYTDIDLDIVWDVLQTKLDDLRILREVFGQYL